MQKNQTRKRVALTHRLLETLKPESEAYRIPDARCAGLAVRVASSGIVTFDLAYRVARSKVFRRLSLGKFPYVSLEAARNNANELTRAARAGRDLIADAAKIKNEAATRVKVRDLISEYAARRLVGKLRTAKEIEARIRRALKSEIDRPADELRRRDIRVLLDATADAGFPREAEQRRIGLNGLFRWALAQDYIETNPMIGLESYGRSPPRQRVLSGDEITTLWAWLTSGDMPADPADVLRLELCLGARCSEIGGMRVEEFDTSNWLWTLPAERSKNKRSRVTPIIGIARTIISERFKYVGSGPLFLTNRGAPLDSMHVGHSLLNNVPPIAKFATHDLRRTVVTQMAEDLSLPLDTIARVIGHQPGSKSTSVLVRHYVAAEFIAEKTQALALWDARLQRIIDGVKNQNEAA